MLQWLTLDMQELSGVLGDHNYYCYYTCVLILVINSNVCSNYTLLLLRHTTELYKYVIHVLCMYVVL